MRTTLPDIIGGIEDLLKDPLIDPYAKGRLGYYLDDLKTFEKEKKANLLSLLDDFRHECLCNDGFGDCRDCDHTEKCETIQKVDRFVLDAKGWQK